MNGCLDGVRYLCMDAQLNEILKKEQPHSRIPGDATTVDCGVGR